MQLLVFQFQKEVFISMQEKLIFNPKKCGGAGECVEVCHNNVWDWQEVEVSIFGLTVKKKIPYPKNQENCTLCGNCVRICPTGAVKFKNGGKY